MTFGAFVEIMDGVEGLVHISELAHHHVENPREVVEPGDDVKVKILEIDSERRRLSLSVKRVAGNEPPPREGGGARAPGAGDDLGEVRDLGLSDDVFAGPDVSGAGDLRAAVQAAAGGSGRGPPATRPPSRGRRGAADAPEAGDAGDSEDAPQRGSRRRSRRHGCRRPSRPQMPRRRPRRAGEPEPDES